MHFSALTNLLLTVFSGLCWTLTYILIIYRSFRDKTYGMPFWAIAFNINWEFIFSVIFASRADPTQLVVNRVWLAFDLAILAAYFAYGMREWPAHLRKGYFYLYSLLVLYTAHVFVYMITVKLDDYTGMYIAFIQNLMMSWLFIAMLNRRHNLSGQSIYIAVLKMAGTLAPTIQFADRSRFVLFLGVSCFIADCIYILMVIHTKRMLRSKTGRADTAND